MNIGRVYTPPMYIARGLYRVPGHTMNIGRVYTPPVLIARGIDGGGGYEIDRGRPTKLTGGGLQN